MSTPAAGATDPGGPAMGEARIRRVGVVGGGIMGSGIAKVCSRAELDVVVVEADPGAVEATQGRVGEALRDGVRVSAELEDLADRELVIEAVVEDKQLKLDLFRRLAGLIADPAAILCSNTSSIPIVELAAATGERAPNVVGLHFFNPVPAMPLVEVIPSLLTSPEAVTRATEFASRELGKDPIVASDRAGFTVSALLIPYLLSAIRMLEMGLSSAEDIDKGMVKGCAHPMGPLALADLIGLDTVMAIAETLYGEHREQLFAPPPLLRRLVAAGQLGRKSGRGLYGYE